MSGQRNRVRRRAILSQHFLRSGALAASLVEQSSVSKNDLVVEIGPGRGVLTRELTGRCRRLIAIEIDERLVYGLSVEFREVRNLVLVHDDFFRFQLPDSLYKVFANLPYSQTAAIIRHLVDALTPPEEAYVVVQREAADRFAGGPYASETLPSLLLKPWWHVEITRRLRRSDFEPPPAVDSVLLWLARRPRPLINQSQRLLYRDFVASSFGRHGGTIRQCLRTVFTRHQIGHLARDLRFSPGASPSLLTFDQWLGLYRFLALDK